MPMTRFDSLLGLRLLGVHQRIYELSHGRIGHRFGRTSMLLMTTTGRKTGRQRTVALLYHRDGDRYVVIGSKGGSDIPPSWLVNLEADPDVVVQVGTRRSPARARVASAAERSRLWPEIVGRHAQFARYQSQTHRLIPLVIVAPRGESAT